MAEIITEENNRFIEKLSRYRNRVIHNETATPFINYTQYGAKPDVVKFRSPKMLLEKFPEYSGNFEEAGEQILNDFLSCVERTILGIRNYVEENRRIPKGEEIYRYKSEIEGEQE